MSLHIFFKPHDHHVPNKNTDCGTYVCPSGYVTIGLPASVLCACCDGACATCTAGSTLCDINSAANTLKCCTANQCTGGPANADANALSTGYNLCSAVTAKTGDTCVPVCAEGHRLVPSTGFTLQCDAV